MKVSTFYKVKNKTKIYTTKKNTAHHSYLRDAFNGKTYQHQDSEPLYFMYPDFPLDEPLRCVTEIEYLG